MKAVYPMVTDNYNLISYSEDFANAAWLNDQASSTANQTIAPNGTNTADKLIENSANNHHLNYQSVSATVGQIYTFSVYLKAAERNYAAIQVADNIVPVNRYTVLVDLINGTILGTRNNNSPTNTSSSIQSVGNGWYRVTATMKQVAGTSFFGHIATSNSATPTYDTIDFPTYTGNGTSGIFIWGAQIELASSASTYQPILTTPSAFMASQMKYNLKDARDLDAAFRLTWSGGWTYSVTGATPNGTNAFADTKFIPNNNGLTINDNSISYYSRTSAANGVTQFYEMGSSNTLGTTDLYSLFTRRSGDTAGYDVGDYTKNRNSFTNTDGSGFYLGKVNSDLTSKLYKNGILSGTKSLTSQAGLSSFKVYIGGFNENDTTVYYSPKQVAFASLGNGLSDNDALVYNQIIEKYQVALSRGVQAARSFYYNSAYSNEANTYLYSTQITGTTQVSAINTLINGLKANNLWAKMKAVYPFVTDKTLQADMAAQMKFNLVNPQDTDAAFRLAFSGGWTYSTNGAFTNGVNAYADTKLNPLSTLSTSYPSFGVYWRNTFNAGQTNIMGVCNTTTVNRLDLGFDVGVTVPFVATSSNSSDLGTGTLNTGYICATRQGISTSKMFRNGAALINGTQTFNGNPNFNFYLAARNEGGTTAYYSNNQQIAFAHIGNGLSDAEALALYNLIQEFQTTLSRNV
jgi:hypothetical protein